jgi:hypothetical protein
MRIKKVIANFTPLRIVFLLIALVSSVGTGVGQDVLTLQGDQFLYDGRPFDMWGIRVASASQSQQVTNHLIAQLNDYKAHGVNTVAVFYQGSTGGYSNPFSSDGMRVDPAHQARMEQIIKECQTRDMVVIVGIFYQRSALPSNAEGVRNAVRTVTNLLKPYRNIIINIANEQNSSLYSDTKGIFDFQDPERNIELCRVVHQVDKDRIVGAGGYDHSKNRVIGRSPDVDTLLFDTSSPSQDSGKLYEEFVAAGARNKPIVNVETFGASAPGSTSQVYSEADKRPYFREVDAGIARRGLYICLFTKGLQEGGKHYDLRGNGTSGNPGMRWYFEYIRDKLKLSAPNPAPPNPTPIGSSFTISLKTGWNLISLPISPSNSSIAEVLKSAGSAIAAVYSYAVRAGRYLTYLPTDSGSNDLTTMEPGPGYWVYVDSAAELRISGEKANGTLDLAEGWNLVGVNSLSSMRVESALAGIEGKYDAVYEFNNETNSYTGYLPPSVTDLKSLKPGLGYWIYMNDAASWTIQGKPSSQTPTDRKEKYTFTENKGVISMEAEHHSSATSFKRLANHEASGGEVMQVIKGTGDGKGSIDFTIDFPSTSKWYVWVRANALTHVSNGIYLKLDGKFITAPANTKYPGIKDIFLKRPGWFWEPEWQGPGKSNRDRPVLIEIPGGRHTFSVANRLVEDPLIDKVVLTREQTQPQGMGPAETLF